MNSAYQFKLETVRTKSVSFALRNQTQPPQTPEELDIQPTMTIVYSERMPQTIDVELKFELSESKLPFTLQVAISGIFVFQELPDKDLLRQVIHVNCASIIFPFLREQIADLTRRAGFPPLVLPPTNFAAMFEAATHPQPPASLTPPKRSRKK